VVSLCGAALDHANLINIVHDLALLKTLGVRLVIVHGARPQLDKVLPQPADAAALRITTATDLAPLRQAMGELRSLLEARFAASLPGSPLYNSEISVISGSFVVAKPVGIIDGVDYQFTGQVRSIRTDALTAQLDLESLVLMSPIGYSRSGQLYNIAAEDLAAEVAIAITADKLITFAEEPYICDAQGAALAELTPAELDDLLASLPSSHADRRRLQAMLYACRKGIARCQQVSYQDDGALLAELFTADGQGSQLAEAPYRNVRTATAADLSEIVALIRPLEQRGVLLRRSRDAIERDVTNFLVAEVDKQIVGCCALHPHGREFMELSCFATHKPTKNATHLETATAPVRASIGEQLLAAAERECARQGFERLFAMTTVAQDWFQEHGFDAIDISELPSASQANYDQARNSRAYLKRVPEKQAYGRHQSS